MSRLHCLGAAFVRSANRILSLPGRLGLLQHKSRSSMVIYRMMSTSDRANESVTLCHNLAGPGGNPTNVVSYVDESLRILDVDYVESAEVIGSSMQVLRLRVPPGGGVQTEAHSMLWSDPEIALNTTIGEGFLAGINRFLSGGGMFLTEYHNDGGEAWLEANREESPQGASSHVAESGNTALTVAHRTAAITIGAGYPARIIPFDLRAYGGQLVACKGSFLAGPLGTTIISALPHSMIASFFGGAGMLLQQIRADDVVFLSAGGTVARRELLEGEVIRVNPGCLLAFTSSNAPRNADADERHEANMEMFQMERVQGLSNMLLGQSLFVGSLRGPGTVWLQSLPWSRVENDIMAKATSHNAANGSSPSHASNHASSSSSSNRS
eukprot:INCI18411.2.p1 GENE.INCI18411.2~~INCI18411.2.p1  ORF type:complete len:382 (+),score=49.52 INCI18411.2:526-1671(+)